MDTPKIATSTQNEISADEFTAAELDAVRGGGSRPEPPTNGSQANYFPPFMFIETSTPENVC